jgi:hypothetical protein
MSHATQFATASVQQHCNFHPLLLAFQLTIQLQGHYTFLGASSWKFNILFWLHHSFYPADIRFQCRVLYAFLNFGLSPHLMTCGSHPVAGARRVQEILWICDEVVQTSSSGEKICFKQSTYVRTHAHTHTLASLRKHFVQKCGRLVVWGCVLNGVSFGIVCLLLSGRKGWNLQLWDALSSPHRRQPLDRLMLGRYSRNVLTKEVRGRGNEMEHSLCYCERHVCVYCQCALCNSTNAQMNSNWLNVQLKNHAVVPS